MKESPILETTSKADTIMLAVWMYEGFMAGLYPDCLSKKRVWIFRSGQWIRR